MAGNDLALAALFADATEADWQAAVEKVLKGKPASVLTGKTDDGIAVAALYTKAAGHGLGRDVPADPAHAWDIRCNADHPDFNVANTAILDDLSGGATSVTLTLDRALRLGDADGEGFGGIAIHCVEDMDKALSGVHLDLVTVALDAGLAAAPAGAALLALGTMRGVKKSDLAVALNADPLAVLAETGYLPQTLETALNVVTTLAATCAADYPKATAVGVSTLPYHNGGASEAQELAAALGTAVAYMRAMEAAGLDVGAAAGQILFRVTADADLFLTIAKLRALRGLWAQILAASGVKGVAAQIEAVSAPRMMSRRDPWVNILRATAAGFGAGTGGADVVTLAGHDSATGVSTGFGRRVARNLQILLQEESNLGRVADPAAGAFAIESFTAELSAKAWALFQDIERAGGMAAALQAGLVQGWIADVRATRDQRIATRKLPLTGVSEFPNIHEAAIETAAFDLDQIQRVARSKTRRGTLKCCADKPFLSILHGVSEGVGFSTVLDGLAGAPVRVEAVPNERLADDFEALRDRADEYLEENGVRPRVALINLGRVADFTARSTFAKNFFEAGGIEAIGNDGVLKGEDADLLLADAPLAVICSSDAVYAEEAEAAAKDLREAGAKRIYLAGRPGELEAALTAAGVDGFIYMGCDVRATLDAALTEVGA